MKRNVFYGALLVLLLGFLVRENRLIHIPKQVEKTEESAEWQPEWYEQMAEEINDSPITLEVDGTMVDPQLGSLRMSQDGQFMIPYGMLPDALSGTFAWGGEPDDCSTPRVGKWNPVCAA